MFKRVTVLAALAMFALVGTAQAQQQGTIEIGVDNALGFDLVQQLDDPADPSFAPLIESRTDFNFYLPAIFWRFGYFASPQFSIELPIGFLLQSTGDNGGTDYAFQSGLNFLYNMDSGLYGGVNGRIMYTSDDPGGDGEKVTGTQFGFGAQVGYRTPFIADNIRFRVGLVYNYMLESENVDDETKATLPALHQFSIPFGLSLMTK